MAHSYTPGLRVTARATVRRERRLPLKGAVLVALGERVQPDTIVARTELPGNVQTVNLAAKLSTEPAKVAGLLLKPIGAAVAKGEVIATAKTMFGLMTTAAECPCDGVLESVSTVTGQLIVREPPIPVEVGAYLEGVVTEVLPGEGVVIEAQGAFLQGIFGVGGETYGPVAIAVHRPDAELMPQDLKPEHRGRVVVGGAFVRHETLMRARDIGVAAVVVGGFDDSDLKRLIGRDLGVAITGSEEIGLTLVLTEGFGHIPMAQRTWRLLSENAGRLASVSGATQIRAGVLRPEIVIPAEGQAPPKGDAQEGDLGVGSLVRVIRQPWFGRIGKVTGMPAALQALETEAMVRVLVVEFADDASHATVPRANIERIAD